MDSRTTAEAPGPHARLMACVFNRGARVLVWRASITPSDEAMLVSVLSELVEIGVLATFGISAFPGNPLKSKAIFDLLRQEVGPLALDAAIGGAKYARSDRARPSLLIPVWDFVPNAANPEMLEAIGIFYGSPIDFKALPTNETAIASSDGTEDAYILWREASPDPRLGKSPLPPTQQHYRVLAALRAE